MAGRILVTGGAGFIGSHLVARLVDEGDEVVVIDSLEPQVHGGTPPEFPDGVTFLEGDVGDRELVERALAGVDSVVHLAAAVGVGQSMYEIERYVDVNTAATAGFLERRRECPAAAGAARRRLVDVDLRGRRVRLRHPRRRRSAAQAGSTTRPAPLGVRLPSAADPS